MPKRKRDSPSAFTASDSDSDAPATSKRPSNRASASSASSATSAAKQRKQLPARLELAKKELTKALKTARGFERQKLSRRRKTAETENKAADVRRIDDEIAALKKIEYARLAEAHLYKTLLKIKSVREHPGLPPWVKVKEGGGEKKKEEEGEGKEGDGGKAGLNVQARLFNANPTKEAMKAVVGDVRAILGVEEVGGKQQQGNKKVKADGGKEKVKAKQAREEAPEEDEDEEGESEEEGGGQDAEAEWDSDEFAGFSDRIAASSDSEDDDEDLETRLAKLKRPYQPVRDLSFTPPSSREASPDASSSEPTFSDEEEEDESPEPERKSKSKSKDKEAPIVAANKSTFLPSLSAVGYISGSDSDSEAEELDEQVAPPKKNRRGQRARQQLAEKKYGKNAKHIAKQKEKEKNNRNAGWDAKRGAVEGGGSGRDRRGGFKPGGRGPQATDANTIELGKKKNHRDDGGKLHPSWEAAKLAKEKAKLANVKFQGKKITFD